MPYITPDAIVAAAKMHLRINHTSDDLFLRKLILDGEKRMDSINTVVKKTVKIRINGDRGKIPEDLWKLHKIADVNDNEYRHDKTHIYFLDNSKDGTYVTLHYHGHNVGEQGFVNIPAEHETPLTHYACYMYAVAHDERYSPQFIQLHMENWKAQKKSIAAKEAYPDGKDKREMSRETHLPVPLLHKLNRDFDQS